MPGKASSSLVCAVLVVAVARRDEALPAELLNHLVQLARRLREVDARLLPGARAAQGYMCNKQPYANPLVRPDSPMYTDNTPTMHSKSGNEVRDKFSNTDTSSTLGPCYSESTPTLQRGGSMP